MTTPEELVGDPAYGTLLEDLKARVRAGRVRAALAANREMILLYWDIGRAILDRQAALGWGAGVVRRLAFDLRHAFPDMRGFSYRNLQYIRSFSASWPDPEIVQQAVAQLPWGHHVVLLHKVPATEARQFYVRKCVEHGWSRAVLAHQIESGLFERQGRAVSNFRRTLLPPTAEAAGRLLKDPYVFDFLALGEAISERDLEASLVGQVQRFLLELGTGFAFVGRQHRVSVAGEEFAIDLLFYHLVLRCFVVIELKVVPFRPEFVGKLNFYLSVVDEQLRHAQDQPTIGLLLCKDKNTLVVEYALRGIDKPVGVASWETRRAKLPDRLADVLPTAEAFQAALSMTRGRKVPSSKTPGEPR